MNFLWRKDINKFGSKQIFFPPPPFSPSFVEEVSGQILNLKLMQTLLLLTHENLIASNSFFDIRYF